MPVHDQMLSVFIQILGEDNGVMLFEIKSKLIANPLVYILASIQKVYAENLCMHTMNPLSFYQVQTTSITI